MGYRAKRKMGEPGKRSAVWGRDFCLRPIPHLGASSQATICKKIMIISKKAKNTIHCFVFYGFLQELLLNYL